MAIGAGVTASAALAVFLGVRFLSPGPRAASAGTQPEKPTTAPAQIAPSGGTGGSTTAPEPKASPPPAPAPQDTSAADRALAARRQELETAARALKLTTIARIGRQQLCVIDGRPLREGDSYRGFVVQKVLGDRVVVVAEGMPFEVRPQPKAEPAPPPAHAAPAAPTPPSPGGPRFYGPGGGGSPEGPGGPPPGGPGGPGGPPPPPRGPRPPGPGGR